MISLIAITAPLIQKIGGQGHGHLLRKGSWGLADQMLISFTNFATMVLLARGLGPAGFGEFTLIYGAMLFANSLQSALVIQPHSVLSTTRQGQEYSDYTTSTAFFQILFVIAAVALALGSGLVSWAANWSTTHLLLALAPCLAAWQLQEFVRRVLYNETRLDAAFYNDLISYGGQTVAIAVLWWFQKLTGPIAMYAIMATSAVGAVVGFWQLRSSLNGRVTRAVFIENWHFGKWLGGAELGYWLSSQIYLYLAAAILGTAATGTLKAAYVIFGPIRILGFFLKSVLPNRFARTLVKGGNAAMAEQVRLVYWMVAPFMGSFCLLVAIFAGPILRVLYGEQYSSETTVLMLYAIFAFVAFMAQIVACALRAKRLTKRIFASQMYASLVAVPVGWIIIKLMGINGAVVGMILTSMVVNFSNWLAYRREITKDDAQAPSEGTAVLEAQVT